MAVVSVSMDDRLLERVDEFVADHGYTGRSEVVREAVRALLGEFRDRRLADRNLAGAVTALFEYDSPDVEARMTELRREHGSLIASNAHHCVRDNGGCVESFVVEGDLAEISAFVAKLRASAETVTVEYSLAPTDAIGEPLFPDR
ncbi:CopG family ribbon-helix-helix protein [Halegenticoccus soli]|uniref:CopG family ribbon-helix-helix protein n=1 Tax=Halegenticoccus soli TaxID=1985678 RepID=UPI000C6EE21E|nr:CopG family ribbon-helix-helix protein [Halegenticoccus soli]